jgi:hypothetical protein
MPGVAPSAALFNPAITTGEVAVLNGVGNVQVASNTATPEKVADIEDLN